MHCCDFLLNQICFFPYEICPCCSKTIENTPLRPRTEFADAHNFDLDSFFELRKKYIEQFKNGVPYCFNNCTLYEPYYHEVVKSDIHPFNYITISNRTYCNCDCIYCEQTHNSTRDEINKFKSYDIVPILQELYEKKLISNGCKFVISGGEVAEYPKKELNYIFELSRKIHGSLLLLSSGIRYSEQIGSVLKNHNVFMTISVDSGTKQVFEKIKRVSAYEKIWDNIRRYLVDCKNNDNANVELKYIVIPGVNDSLEEAEAFINKCISVGCKYIKTEIEHFYMNENYDKKLPETTKEVFFYFFRVAKEKNMKLMTEGVGRPWVMKKLYE